MTDPIVHQSLEYKQAYVVEGSTKSTKSYLLTQAINQPSIPDTFWDPVLASRYVENLNKLFSSIYAFRINRTKVGTIGSLELLITEPEPSITKKITDQCKWTITFWKYCEARVFAFGNEAEQLTRYQDWIECQFTVVHPQHHQHVIDGPGLPPTINTNSMTSDPLFTSTRNMSAPSVLAVEVDQEAGPPELVDS
ncbi:hypothetical protein M407DRAFT_8292 [Tulasnella calospora MUT 4182]|uniref:Uncharacterized protein n=1 Tax=Tulasnella calospora MUT 4182 TaxID=1051891 RepID=A0A0C3Q7M7_9AGAM|nr:hypothetical protein M407DRAFT_8292 [Tulasnella calospora MUT 4182]